MERRKRKTGQTTAHGKRRHTASDKVVEPNRPGSADALNKSRRTERKERREERRERKKKRDHRKGWIIKRE
jgi:hypothetical protein